jgi:N utilization substance protein B
MKALYALELGEDDVDHFVRTLLEPELEDDSAALEFATRLFRRTVDRTGETDEIIARHAQNWDLNRITPIDRSLLRMATTELLDFDQVPPKVSIDEAIEIAKKFSTPRSGTFVNGILDAILTDLKQAGRLTKRGRGLVGMESIDEHGESA